MESGSLSPWNSDHAGPARIERGEINLASFSCEAIDRCCFGAVVVDIKPTPRSWMDHSFKIFSPAP